MMGDSIVTPSPHEMGVEIGTRLRHVPSPGGGSMLSGIIDEEKVVVDHRLQKQPSDQQEYGDRRGSVEEKLCVVERRSRRAAVYLMSTSVPRRAARNDHSAASNAPWQRRGDR
jgi:hypothetical protein